MTLRQTTTLVLAVLSLVCCAGDPSDFEYRLDNDTGRAIFVENCDGKRDVRVAAGGSCDIGVPPGEKFDVAFRFSQSEADWAGCLHGTNPTGETPWAKPFHYKAAALVPCRE